MKALVLASMLLTTNVALACGGHTTATADISEAPGTHVTFAVKGMSCGSCADRITASLTELDGVNAVAVSHETGKAEVAYDAAKLDEKKLTEAIEALDFKAKVETPKKG